MTPTIDLAWPVCIQLDSAEDAGKRLLLIFLELLLSAWVILRQELNWSPTKPGMSCSQRATQHFHFLEVRLQLESHQSKGLVAAFRYT